MKNKNKNLKVKQKNLSQSNTFNIDLQNETLKDLKQEDYSTKFQLIQQSNQNMMNLNDQMIKNDLEPIGLINLSLEKTVNIQRIKSWIEIYLGLEVQILNLQLALYYENHNFYIIDIDHNQTYKLRKDKKDIINVVSIFKVLKDVKPTNIKSLIAIVDQDIFDPFCPEANIVGRAGQGKVCVVQVQSEPDDFYSTIVHELLHTLGFGHCKFEDCLMYANISTTMQLCQKHLQQLNNIKNIDEYKRYKALLEISRKIGLKNECKILEKLTQQENEIPMKETHKLIKLD